MTEYHLFSASLFRELFQHNLVSPDGRIIASDQQLQDYSTFLIKQWKDRTASLHAERKKLINDVEDLLRLEDRTEEENKLLEMLINELDLEFDECCLLRLKKPRKPQERYLGPKEPQKSAFVRKIEAELERVKILKRDLRKLDDWLEQISHYRPITVQGKQPIDWNAAGRKYRQRTTNRMCDMEIARTKLIKHHYKDYDKELKSILDRKMPKERYLSRLSTPITKHAKKMTPKYVRDGIGVIAKAQKSIDAKTNAKLKHKATDKSVATIRKESSQDETAAKYDGKYATAYEQKCLEDEAVVKDVVKDVLKYIDKDDSAASKAEKNIEDGIAEKDNAKGEDVTAKNAFVQEISQYLKMKVSKYEGCNAAANDEKILEDKAIVKDVDKTDSMTRNAEKMVQDEISEDNTKGEDGRTSEQERAEDETAMKVNDNTENENKIFEATENKILDNNEKKDLSASKIISSVNVVTTEAQNDAENEISNHKILNNVIKNSKREATDKTKGENVKTATRGSRIDIKITNNEYEEPDANTNCKKNTSKVEITYNYDDDSNEVTISHKSFHTDSTAKQWNGSRKRFETGVADSPIDEDVVTQVQLDAQKEGNNTDEVIEDTNEASEK